MDKEIQLIDNSKKIGRPNFEFTPKILEQVKTMKSISTRSMGTRGCTSKTSYSQNTI
jgi:hypothetical protein